MARRRKKSWAPANARATPVASPSQDKPLPAPPSPHLRPLLEADLESGGVTKGAEIKVNNRSTTSKLRQAPEI
jgi:hypothetical protein